MERQRDFSHTPGVQVAIRVGDELGASFALGSSNLRTGEGLTTAHLFHIASHSKTFTATAVLQLVEAGRLRLDDAVEQWIEELAGSPMARVTVRELLGHQSGVNRDGSDSDYWQLDGDFPDRDGVLAFAREQAVFEPNQHFKYSNIGYSLLGLVIEAASGQSYFDYVIEHIVDPLGLVSTGPEVPAERRSELAGAHGIRLDAADERAVIDDVPSNAEAAATGFYSTAEEVTRYLVCHSFGRDELLSDASKRLMQRRESRITRGGERFYGLGFQMVEVNGRMLVGHSGGWPGHITQSWLDAESGLCVSVLTNTLGGPASQWATQIVRLLDRIVEAEGPGPAEVPEGIDPTSFTGRYCCLWGIEDIALLGTRLYVIPASSTTPHEDATVLKVVDDCTLRAEPEDSYGATGEDYLFTRDAHGRVRSVRQGGMTSWPEEAWRERH
ncbi:serine hydrolase domain-containing protein [Luteococcus sediminum]